MRIVINDIHIRLIGHNLGYVQNIFRYLEEHPSDDEFLFILNPEAKRIPTIRCSSPKVTIQFLTDEEFAPYTTLPMQQGTRQVWQSIIKYATDFRADKLVLLELDIFQHTVGSAKVPFEISGIMLRPYPRVIAVDDSFKSKIQIQIRKLKKIATAWWMCRNPKLKHAFILNDALSISEMNRQMNTKAFTYLPDPVFDYPSREGLNIREKYNISVERKIFLVFGNIDEKKNVLNILSAMQKLSAEEAEKYCLMIVGKVHESYQKSLQETLAETQTKQPKLQIITESRFVADDEMECFVGQCDVISLAYINFFSSSGVIGLASRHNRPIIAAKYGVVGYQTQEYQLGLRIDPHSVAELTEAIRYFLENKDNYPKKSQEFVKNHSRDIFIETLLDL